MKNSQQTPIPTAATMDGKLFEALRSVVIDALSDVPVNGAVILEIFPDVASLMLKSARPDASTDGDFARNQPLEGDREFGMTETELRRVLQRCIDADRPLRMMLVHSDLSGLKPRVTSLN
jgi:hypothetical protein